MTSPRGADSGNRHKRHVNHRGNYRARAHDTSPRAFMRQRERRGGEGALLYLMLDGHRYSNGAAEDNPVPSFDDLRCAIFHRARPFTPPPLPTTPFILESRPAMRAKRKERKKGGGGGGGGGGGVEKRKELDRRAGQ